MDFFERQADARRRTVLLLLAFSLAVLAIVLAVLTVVHTLFVRHATDAPDLLAWLAEPAAWGVAALVLGTILAGSAHRFAQLAQGGGDRVARLLGGRLVDPDTRHPRESVLINVVEEMAIASGTTVPNVYVLDDEPGLNAFAAGVHPAHAVVAVTRGLLAALERDELQGVIAHEFSHILNGDMRLNLRLVALLAGITMLGELGTWAWRSHRTGRRHRLTARPGSGSGGGAAAALALGLALIVIGWIGVLFGRLIKAALSRRREFLADAAAVQFTRNPDGIGGALTRIATDGSGSTLRSRLAEEISHMGFARTVGGLTRLTTTHPPIEARMQALGPKYVLWLTQARREQRRRKRAAGHRGENAAMPGGGGGVAASPGGAGPRVAGLAVVPEAQDPVATTLSAAALAAMAGRLDAADLDHGRALLHRLPSRVRHALHGAESAGHSVLALVLPAAPAREQALAALPAEDRGPVRALRLELERDCPGPAAQTLDPSIRLAVLELAGPGLRRLGADARRVLLRRIDDLIRADGRLAVFEYALRTLVAHELRERGGTAGDGNKPLAARRAAVLTVLSLLSLAAGGDEAGREAAYCNAAVPLFGTDVEPPLPPEACTLAAFSQALERLDALRPLARRAVITACGDCVTADGRIRPVEAELLRVVAAVLGTPVPPLRSA